MDECWLLRCRPPITSKPSSVEAQGAAKRQRSATLCHRHDIRTYADRHPGGLLWHLRTAPARRGASLLRPRRVVSGRARRGFRQAGAGAVVQLPRPRPFPPPDRRPPPALPARRHRAGPVARGITTELLNLLNALGLLVRLEARQADLLARICAGKLLSAAQVKAARDAEPAARREARQGDLLV